MKSLPGEAVGGALLHGYGDVCGRKARKKCKGTNNAEESAGSAKSLPRVRIGLRPFQLPVFRDRSTGILVLHWSRQIGKSFVLAAWAVDRLLSRPGRLVTVLSNSRDNGAEFVAKCAEVCRLNGTEYKSVDKSRGVQFQNMRMEVRIRAEGKVGRIKVLAANPRTARGFSGDLILDEFAFHEDSQAIWDAAEPILASSPDFLCRMASTGNGRHNLFYRMCSGSTGVPPVAFGVPPKESDSDASNEPPGSEGGSPQGPPLPPVKSSLPDVFSSSESTVNPQPDSYYPMIVTGVSESPDSEVGSSRPAPMLASGCDDRLVAGANLVEAKMWEKNEDETNVECLGVLVGTGIVQSPAGFAVSRITRTMAHGMGVKIYDANTRASITPEQARAQALDKRSYDQNYECSFADENLTLLSHELISAAEREGVGFICEGDWSQDCLRSLLAAHGSLFVGFDVGRKVDLSVITVMEDLNGLKVVRGILRIQNMRLPEQQQRLGEVCRMARFRRAAIDMTGLGLGLFEYAQEEFGAGRIAGINFASTVPATRAVALEGRKRETVRVTEAMAMELLQAYEDRRIQHPADARLRDDLRKPEKITTPGGRVSIAATRDEAGHADHFWSFALALEAAASAPAPFAFQVIPRPERGIFL
jgi:phage FluMu gp28-like protein